MMQLPYHQSGAEAIIDRRMFPGRHAASVGEHVIGEKSAEDWKEVLLVEKELKLDLWIWRFFIW